MTRLLTVPVRISHKRYADQAVVEIDFQDHPISDWCLHLALLEEDLISSFLLMDKEGGNSIEFKKAGKVHADGRSQYTLFSEKTQVRLTEGDLGYVYYFFLNYYRDGLAEVGHIDIEADTAESKGDYITFKVSKRVRPMSPHELRKKMERRD